MSREHTIEVVRLGPVRPHGNADSLDITDVHGGYPCVVKRGSFSEGDLAAYVPIDSIRERYDERVRRVILKLHGQGHLLASR